MDLLSPRAIPALIAGLAIFASHAECEALNGTYAYRSAAPVEGMQRYLSDLAQGPERSKLMKQESAGKAQGFASAQPRSRPKVTHIATAGTLSAQAKGATIEFHDAQDKPLARVGNDLVYTETVTNVDPPGGKPRRTEIRYAGK